MAWFLQAVSSGPIHRSRAPTTHPPLPSEGELRIQEKDDGWCAHRVWALPMWHIVAPSLHVMRSMAHQILGTPQGGSGFHLNVAEKSPEILWLEWAFYSFTEEIWDKGRKTDDKKFLVLAGQLTASAQGLYNSLSCHFKPSDDSSCSRHFIDTPGRKKWSQ